MFYFFFLKLKTGNSMEQDKNATLVNKIKKKATLIIKDYKNANYIIDLLRCLQKDSQQIVCASCHALETVFSHFISAKQFPNAEKNYHTEEDLSKEDKFSSWLKDQFTATCDVLYTLLSHESTEVKKSALKAFSSFLRAEEGHNIQTVTCNLIEHVTCEVTSSDVDQTDIIREIEMLWKSEEKSYGIISQCLTHTGKRLKSAVQPITDTFQFNCWKLIKQIAAQDLDDKCRRQLTSVICDFLKEKMSATLYRDILTGISVIMEKMSSPLRLTDFLSESFNIGGAISLMSLHGLFILMHKYNLDYPDFYTKLYSMFKPQIFSAKYRARFFHLADTFLSSTHLPSYLVAAFVKRLARLSLHAPASVVYITIPFIFNLIARHPSLEIMLGRKDVPNVIDSDPFIAEDKDPAVCKALDSCLWELQTLEHHYDPSISQKAQKRKMAEQDLSALLETTTSDIIASYAKKIKKETIPLNYLKSNGFTLCGNFVL